jgi:2,3-bisphosphoglycerate-dependent phosphoglycerate mutase
LDYGPDEAKPEEEVVARIGQKALDAWDKQAVVPPGWEVNPAAIENGWMEFVRDVLCDNAKTILVVTSNGVARFAPAITGDFEAFTKEHSLKLSTGAVASFRWEKHHWLVDYWNRKP